jgi:hypothetical protein
VALSRRPVCRRNPGRIMRVPGCGRELSEPGIGKFSTCGSPTLLEIAEAIA